MELNNKNLLLIICGGISAYKNLDLIRNLKNLGMNIKVILSKSAKEFVTPLSVASLSKNKVYDNEFTLNNEIEMDHIALSRWADLVMICPATANMISEIARGSAKDLITTVIMASNKKVFLIPAMNSKMWENKINQQNVKKLKLAGYYFLGPDNGELACGEFGIGKMSKTEEIVLMLKNFFAIKNIDLKAIVTAGPTREYIDPVRYITNESSGKQGFEIAKKLKQAGFKTKLILGPSNIDAELEVDTQRITTCDEMFNATQNSLPCDVLVMCAAIADFKFKKNQKKIKRKTQGLKIDIDENIDILKHFSNLNQNRPKLVVGFAAETEDLVRNGKAKLLDKRCDWIIANDVSNKNLGFNSDTNKATIIYKNMEIENLPEQSKSGIASNIVNRILRQFDLNDKRDIN